MENIKSRHSCPCIKVNFKPKLISKDKKGQHMLITGTIHQEDITFVTSMYQILGPFTHSERHKEAPKS